jgi:hypothetical protein
LTVRKPEFGVPVGEFLEAFNPNLWKNPAGASAAGSAAVAL